MNELLDYLSLFSLTYALETPIYFLGLRKYSKLRQILFISLVLNLATHPIVCFLFPVLADILRMNYDQYLILAEVFAPLVEFLLLRFVFKFSMQRSLLVAVAANLVSWLIGSRILH